MTCPHCGAYSPKNTSICNRCGRKLPLLEAQREQQRQRQESGSAPSLSVPEHEGYGYGYRQPEQTKLGMFLEKVGTFLDENVLENPTVKKAVIACAGVLVLLIILLNCFGVCSGCFGCRSDDAPVSATDVSSTDVSGSDVSFSDLSPTDSAAQS